MTSRKLITIYYLLLTTYSLLLTLNFLLPLAVLLAGCTLYERLFGTEIAHAHIYDALWFHTLWGIVLVYACMEGIRRKIWKRPLIALLHAAFVLIAIGYAFTCYHATSGKLHLRSGVTATHYFTDDLRVKVLPLPLTLKEVVFTSSEHPEAYSIIISNQIEEEKLGVNSVLEINYNRFYQSALDRDGKGVNLTIIHDPIGRWLSHAGFYLFIVTAILWMGRRFWNKCRKKKFTPIEVKTTPTTRTILVISSLVAAFGYYAFFKKYLTQGFAPLISIQDTIHVLTLLLLTATIPLTPYFKSKKIIYISQIILCASLSYTILFNNNIQTSIPQILNSPWLFSHVVLIIIAYSLFTLCALIALATFVVKNVPAYQRLTTLSRNLLAPAVVLLCMGIIIGAIWAGSAWGNYWQWDPKEVWALITLLSYCIPLHRNLKGGLKTARQYHIFMLAAYLSVLMTYLGVTYLLGGLHSYG